MANIRVRIGDPEQSGLDVSDLDIFIQDMAQRLSCVIEEHWRSYFGEARALYYDLEQYVLPWWLFTRCYGRGDLCDTI